MWVVVDSSITHVFCCQCTYQVPHLYICSDWLITKNANIKTSIWATVMELGMGVEVDSRITQCSVVVDAHIKYQYLICIFVLIG